MIRFVLVVLLRGYKRAVSPFLPAACRFYPTCSEYAAEAIANHGVIRGVALAASRLARCHPWHPGGVDLVPPKLQATLGTPGSLTGTPAQAPARPLRAKPVGYPK